MYTDNKGFMKLITVILVFFLFLMAIFKSEDSLFTAFKFIFIIILFAILLTIFSLIIIVKRIKKYFDFQQQLEYDFNKFFNDFYQAEFEFKRYQNFKQTQDEFRQNKQQYNDNFNRYTYNNYNKDMYSKDITKALILFGYKDINLVTKEDLKKKYRYLMKKAHPDNGGSVEKTQTLTECYNILLNFLKK